MYEAFYGLREKPFNLTPDPKFLYLSDKHKEAFAHLLFGIKNRSGFVMVTGEIGTGKTTICRNLLNQLDDDVEVAFIFNPALNPVELLKKINMEFGVDATPSTALELIDLLNAYLLQAAGAGKNCVLVIDEAQNLEPNVLEQIRLLSNLETETEKLLQIILIGQPELGEKLALHQLRQLNQRITARYHLKPLDEQEAFQYIAYRLHVAGARRKALFERAAARLVFKLSGGTPRVINALCDRALLIGYTRESQTITKAIVQQAYREIRGERIVEAKSRWNWRTLMPSPALVGMAIVVLIIAIPLNRIASQWGNFNQIISTGNVPGDNDVRRSGLAPADARSNSPDETAAGGLNPAARQVLQQIAGNGSAVNEAVADAHPGDAFQDIAPETARQAAVAAMLRAWNFTLVSAYPDTDNPDDIADFAQRHQFSLEKLEPAIDQLLAINLPALVRITVNEQSMWSALTKATEDGKLRLTTRLGETTELSRDAFRELYQAEALVFWRDPAPNTPVLLEGRSGAAVATLKEGLRQLGRLPDGNGSAQYDQSTATAISRIQAETGLLVDGIAGKQVRMIMSSWLGDDATPSLQARPELLARTVPVRPLGTAEASSPAPEPATSPTRNEAPAAAPSPGEAESEPEPQGNTASPAAQNESSATNATTAQPGNPPPFLDILPPATETERSDTFTPGGLPTWAALREAAAEAQAAAAAGQQALPESGSGSWVQVQELAEPDTVSNGRGEVTPPAATGAPLVPSSSNNPNGNNE